MAKSSKLDELDIDAINELCAPYDAVLDENPFALFARVDMATSFVEGLSFIQKNKPKEIAFEFGVRSGSTLVSAAEGASGLAVDDGARELAQVISKKDEHTRTSAEALIIALLKRAEQKFGYVQEERSIPPNRIVRLRLLNPPAA